MAASLPGWGLAVLVIVLDQLSKWWILEHVMRPPQVIEITSFFNLVLTWNRGISFGLFARESGAAVWILSALALLIAAFLARWLVRASSLHLRVALGMVIGGAVGNVADRLRFGAVVDFVDLHAMGWHWPAFNVADAAIVVGAAILVGDGLFGDGETPKNDDTAHTG